MPRPRAPASRKERIDRPNPALYAPGLSDRAAAFWTAPAEAAPALWIASLGDICVGVVVPKPMGDTNRFICGRQCRFRFRVLIAPFFTVSNTSAYKTLERGRALLSYIPP